MLVENTIDESGRVFESGFVLQDQTALEKTANTLYKANLSCRITALAGSFSTP